MADNNKDLRVPEQKQSLTESAAPSTANNESTEQEPFKPPYLPPDPLLGQKAEEYLRESGTIEDLPDEKDETEYKKIIEDEKNKSAKQK